MLFAAVAVFGLTNVNAQDVVFGAKAGVNFSNFGGDADTDGTTSFYVGGLADFTVSEKFHVQPELLYSDEGAEDLSVSFLRVPIMAKYYVADGISLQAGPQFGFKIGADDAIDDAIKSFDLGLGLGAGYELEGGLFFDARYNLGLTSLSEDDDFDITTGSFQIGLGYRFGN